MLFNQLGLSAEPLRAVNEQGYKTATPIQQQTVRLTLDGSDVPAGAQTGKDGWALPEANYQDFASLTRRTMKLIRCPLSSEIARSACCLSIST